MKLRHITITGIDLLTEIDGLQELQEKFPWAEFGILFSKHWQQNGQRYPNPAELLPDLADRGLHLSAHICGSMAREIIYTNNWQPFSELIEYHNFLFDRVQLNVASMSFPSIQSSPLSTPSFCKEVIIQQRSTMEIDVYKAMANKRNYVSILFDQSGGRGQNLDLSDINQNPYIKAGYAGGINPDNVATILNKLFQKVNHPFWIDTESGVRTRDYLDLEKVYKLLSNAKEVIDNWENEFE